MDSSIKNLFFVHPLSIDLLQIFPHILIIDYTYKIIFSWNIGIYEEDIFNCKCLSWTWEMWQLSLDINGVEEFDG